MKIKYKQHYIPQGYLRKWYDDNNRLWIIRNNKIFTSRTENICQENLFYKVDSLNDKELCAITYMILKIPEPSRSYLLYIIDILNQMATKEKELILSIKNNPANNNIRCKEELNKIKILTSNALEDIYSLFDTTLCEHLNSIINSHEKDSIIKDTPDHILLFDIITQLYKTNKTRYHSIKITEKLQKEFPLINDFDWRKITLYIPIILGYETANRMIYNKYEMYVVINKTSIPFITSDNPVININRNSNIGTYIYPISPNKAIIISRIGVKIDFSKTKNINSINKKIIKESHEIVIFNNKKISKKYIKYIYITSKIKKIKYYFLYRNK